MRKVVIKWEFFSLPVRVTALHRLAAFELQKFVIIHGKRRESYYFSNITYQFREKI